MAAVRPVLGGTESRAGAPERRFGSLRPDEYAEVCRRLGRDPSPAELGMFGVMWSEHCAYKHSRVTLRRLPTKGPGVLRGPGENAGVVDAGGGLAAVFKMESHNHPSAVAPFHGAATGVGGIIRDVLAMGARPTALLDSLRFGPLSEPAVAPMVHGVVAGIAAYGNSIGVPTVGGELRCAPSTGGIRSSTSRVWDWCRPIGSRPRAQRARATRWSISARAPAGMACRGRRSPPPSSPATRPIGPPCRWAIRSRASC